ncbi:MAG: STAS domain-containing protein [Spirulina sp. SIO3F2]|nr:STAS domain-containing protein [Spirulina sp. SIO3F2]
MMILDTEVQRIPMQLAQGCIVASIQIDLTETVIAQFRQDLLTRLQETGAKGVILDLSGVEVMDLEDFEALDALLSMTAVMGAKNILTGFQPGVVSTLIDFNIEIDHLNATLDLDAAFELMQQLTAETHGLESGMDNEEPMDVEDPMDLKNTADMETSSMENLEENEFDNKSAETDSDLGSSRI